MNTNQKQIDALVQKLAGPDVIVTWTALRQEAANTLHALASERDRLNEGIDTLAVRSGFPKSSDFLQMLTTVGNKVERLQQERDRLAARCAELEKDRTRLDARTIKLTNAGWWVNTDIRQAIDDGIAAIAAQEGAKP